MKKILLFSMLGALMLSLIGCASQMNDQHRFTEVPSISALDSQNQVQLTDLDLISLESNTNKHHSIAQTALDTPVIKFSDAGLDSVGDSRMVTSTKEGITGSFYLDKSPAKQVEHIPLLQSTDPINNIKNIEIDTTLDHNSFGTTLLFGLQSVEEGGEGIVVGFERIGFNANNYNYIVVVFGLHNSVQSTHLEMTLKDAWGFKTIQDGKLNLKLTFQTDNDIEFNLNNGLASRSYPFHGDLSTTHTVITGGDLVPNFVKNKKLSKKIRKVLKKKKRLLKVKKKRRKATEGAPSRLFYDLKVMHEASEISFNDVRTTEF